MQNKVLLLSLILLLVYFNSFTQITRSRFISAYLYNFAKNTTWPNEKIDDSFTLVCVTTNKELVNELDRMTKSLTLNSKKINLKITPKVDSLLLSAQMVFVAGDKPRSYLDAYDMVENNPILLVSENLTDQRIVMLNLYSVNNNILFEMNKVNILNQGLIVSDEILISRGKEIDVIKMYLESQQSLRSMEKQISNFEQKLAIFNNQIAKSKLSLNQQNETIRQQRKTIELQQEKYNDLTYEMDSLFSQITFQREIMETEKAKLNLLRDSLSNNQRILNKQLLEIDNGKKTLLEQESEINLMNKDIVDKNFLLSERDKTITRQKRTMYVFGTLITLIISLTLILAKAFRKNRQKNILLSQQKAELNSKNNELSETINQLKITQDQLINSEKMASLGILTAGIAHEINNPINFVYTGAANLKQEFDDIDKVIKELNIEVTSSEEAYKKLQDIKKVMEEIDFNEAYSLIPQIVEDIKVGAQRTAEIVDGLKNFSRMDESSFSNIDLHKVLNGALVLLKNQLKIKDSSVIKNYEAELPLIEGNPGKINQVLLNIINNAIDSIANAGTITITTLSQDGSVKISIKDNGKGMDTGTIEKIFDPFYTTKEIGKGTGLGLSISYGIINDHNGEISVNSKEGDGTEFIISLPLKQSHKEQYTT